MLASPEQQTGQVLSMFPWAFIFLAPPESPSLSPAATATAPASETAAAAAFRKRLHQLRLSLLFLMLFVPVNDWRAGWSSAAVLVFFAEAFFLFCVEADTVSEIVSSKNIQDNSQLQKRSVEWSPLLNSLYIYCIWFAWPTCTWLGLFPMQLSVLWKIWCCGQFWKCYIFRIRNKLTWISIAPLQLKLREDLGYVSGFKVSLSHKLHHAPNLWRGGFISVLLFLLQGSNSCISSGTRSHPFQVNCSGC